MALFSRAGHVQVTCRSEMHDTLSASNLKNDKLSSLMEFLCYIKQMRKYSGLNKEIAATSMIIKRLTLFVA